MGDLSPKSINLQKSVLQSELNKTYKRKTHYYIKELIKGCKKKRYMVNPNLQVNNFAIKVNANLRSGGPQTFNLLSQLGYTPHQVSLTLAIFIRGPQL